MNLNNVNSKVSQQELKDFWGKSHYLLKSYLWMAV